MESPESPRACATACAKRPSWKPCWMSPRPACSAASPKSFSSRPESASRSAQPVLAQQLRELDELRVHLVRPETLSRVGEKARPETLSRVGENGEGVASGQ